MSLEDLIHRYPDAQSAAEACGARIIALLSEVDNPTLAISGGTSPKIMFAYLSRSRFDWSKVHIFWVDERCVPPDDPQSNYKLAHDTWLKDFPGAQIHRVKTELGPEAAAEQYAEEIRPFLPLHVIHRGMGADAHTASLFPGDPLIQNQTGLVGVAKREVVRVTLLPLVLKSAARTVILATGKDKAHPLKFVLEQPYDPLKYPCQIASRDSSTAGWFIDEAAAAKL
jgi:6-phosphogluconolactonase